MKEQFKIFLRTPSGELIGRVLPINPKLKLSLARRGSLDFEIPFEIQGEKNPLISLIEVGSELELHWGEDLQPIFDDASEEKRSFIKKEQSKDVFIIKDRALNETKNGIRTISIESRTKETELSNRQIINWPGVKFYEYKEESQKYGISFDNQDGKYNRYIRGEGKLVKNDDLMQDSFIVMLKSDNLTRRHKKLQLIQNEQGHTVPNLEQQVELSNEIPYNDVDFKLINVKKDFEEAIIEDQSGIIDFDSTEILSGLAIVKLHESFVSDRSNFGPDYDWYIETTYIQDTINRPLTLVENLEEFHINSYSTNGTDSTGQDFNTEWEYNQDLGVYTSRNIFVEYQIDGLIERLVPTMFDNGGIMVPDIHAGHTVELSARPVERVELTDEQKEKLEYSLDGILFEDCLQAFLSGTKWSYKLSNSFKSKFRSNIDVGNGNVLEIIEKLAEGTFNAILLYDTFNRIIYVYEKGQVSDNLSNSEDSNMTNNGEFGYLQHTNLYLSSGKLLTELSKTIRQDSSATIVKPYGATKYDRIDGISISGDDYIENYNTITNPYKLNEEDWKSFINKEIPFSNIRIEGSRNSYYGAYTTTLQTPVLRKLLAWELVKEMAEKEMYGYTKEDGTQVLGITQDLNIAIDRVNYYKQQINSHYNAIMGEIRSIEENETNSSFTITEGVLENIFKTFPKNDQSKEFLTWKDKFLHEQIFNYELDEQEENLYSTFFNDGVLHTQTELPLTLNSIELFGSQEAEDKYDESKKEVKEQYGIIHSIEIARNNLGEYDQKAEISVSIQSGRKPGMVVQGLDIGKDPIIINREKENDQNLGINSIYNGNYPIDFETDLSLKIQITNMEEKFKTLQDFKNWIRDSYTVKIYMYSTKNGTHVDTAMQAVESCLKNIYPGGVFNGIIEPENFRNFRTNQGLLELAYNKVEGLIGKSFNKDLVWSPELRPLYSYKELEQRYLAIVDNLKKDNFYKYLFYYLLDNEKNINLSNNSLIGSQEINMIGNTILFEFVYKRSQADNTTILSLNKDKEAHIDIVNQDELIINNDQNISRVQNFKLIENQRYRILISRENENYIYINGVQYNIIDHSPLEINQISINKGNSSSNILFHKMILSELEYTKNQGEILSRLDYEIEQEKNAKVIFNANYKNNTENELKNMGTETSLSLLIKNR